MGDIHTMIFGHNLRTFLVQREDVDQFPLVSYKLYHGPTDSTHTHSDRFASLDVAREWFDKWNSEFPGRWVYHSPEIKKGRKGRP